MINLEDLRPNAAVRGIIPDSLITVVNVQCFGSGVLELTYKIHSRRVGQEILYRYDEPRLELVEHGRPWSFDGDCSLFLFQRPRVSAWHTFSTRCWQPIPTLLSRCRTRLPQSTSTCSLAPAL